MKDKIRNWIIGIGCGDHQYKIGDVTYTVSSCFETTNTDQKLIDKFKRTIVSDFAPLTIFKPKDIMADEYVCSGCMTSDDV